MPDKDPVKRRAKQAAYDLARRSKKAAYYQANRVRIRAREQAYHEAHKNDEAYKEGKRASSRKYAASHAETVSIRRSRRYQAQERENAAYQAKNRARARAHYAAHRIEKIAYQSAYTLAHLTQVRANGLVYRMGHRTEKSIYDAAYLRAHPEENHAYRRRRRAAMRQAPINDLSAPQWLEIQAAQDHRCAHCKKRCKGKLTQEHISPLGPTGPHTLHNIVGVCRSCNSKKGRKPSPVLVQPLLLTVAPAKKKR